MALLGSTTLFYNSSTYVDRVASQIMNQMRYDDFEVDGVKMPSGDWDISIKKGNLFKAVLGLQTALKINISTASPHSYVKLGVGVFGQQAIPTILTLCVWWPFVIPQIWGLIQQNKLDNLVMDRIQNDFNNIAGRIVNSKRIN